MARNPNAKKDHNTKENRSTKGQTYDQASTYSDWSTLPSNWMEKIGKKESRINRQINKEVVSIIHHRALNSWSQGNQESMDNGYICVFFLYITQKK
jgi:hypothetical protein